MSIVTFKDSEKQCEVCGKALPAFSCTDLRKHFTCGRESCRKAVRQKSVAHAAGGGGREGLRGTGLRKAHSGGAAPKATNALLLQ